MSLDILTRAFSGGVQRRQHRRRLLLIMHRHRRRPDIPILPTPIAQPEDAGLRVGWVLHLVGDLPLFTAMKDGALDRVPKTDRTLI